LFLIFSWHALFYGVVCTVIVGAFVCVYDLQIHVVFFTGLMDFIFVPLAVMGDIFINV